MDALDGLGVVSFEVLTRCDSSKVMLRLARISGPTLEELLRSFTEDALLTRLVGEGTAPGISEKGGDVGSAVAPRGMIGIGRGYGLGARSQRAA